MPMFRGIFCFLAMLGCFATVHPAAGQTAEPDELEQRIEELRKQIAELLAAVPEDQREETVRRLLEKPPTESTESPARVEPPTPPPPVPRPIRTITSRDEVASAQETEPPPTRRRRARKCNTLDFLDENADGQISAADRHWRYLYFWIDKNRDSTRQEKEIVSAYEAGVREISLDLETFTRKKGPLGEIRRGEGLLFDLDSNGFGQGRRVDDGLLLIDATALGRGNGPEILGPNQESIQGLAAWARGWTIKTGDTETALTCP